jgi:hypothetical protein
MRFAVPQNWMTDKEIAGLICCHPEQARPLVAARGLARKKQRDRETHLKLDLPQKALCIEKISQIDEDLELHTCGTPKVCKPAVCAQRGGFATRKPNRLF